MQESESLYSELSRERDLTWRPSGSDHANSSEFGYLRKYFRHHSSYILDTLDDGCIVRAFILAIARTEPSSRLSLSLKFWDFTTLSVSCFSGYTTLS